MQMPVYSPQKYNTPGVPDEMVGYYNPQGAKGISCFECVKRGENVIKYTDAQGKEQTDECGLNSSVLMAVMQIGLAKQNIAARRTEINWVNVCDLKDIEGNQVFSAPFIANVRISRMPVTKAIGRKLQVKTVESGGYAPADSQTLGAFLKQMHNEGIVRPARGGKVIYNAVVEMHAAQPTEVFAKDISNLIKAIPVFSVVRDSVITGNNINIWLSTAWSTYETELNAAKLHGASAEVKKAEAEVVEQELVSVEVMSEEQPVQLSQKVYGRKSKD
jgi:hypothetical protein